MHKYALLQDYAFFCYDYANIVSIVTANKYKLENIVTNIIKLQY